jgi:hydrogenase maturation protease
VTDFHFPTAIRPEWRPGRHIKPLLILCCGNPCRGDDALGSMAAVLLMPDDGDDWADYVDVRDDYQLQSEHVPELRHRREILFIDASDDDDAPWRLKPAFPRPDGTVDPAMTPAALLHAYQQAVGEHPPNSYVLAVRGYRFEPGEPMSEGAERNLHAAVNRARQWIADHVDEINRLYPPQVPAAGGRRGR